MSGIRKLATGQGGGLPLKLCYIAPNPLDQKACKSRMIHGICRIVRSQVQLALESALRVESSP